MIEKLFASSNALPLILQSERAECALACLAMVASYHGHRVDLNSLRHEFPQSARGSSLKDLLLIADRLGLQCRGLRLEPQELATLQLPVILHWDMTHFVVLQSVSHKGVVIHDPAVGRRHYDMHELGRHFTGIAVECLPGTDFTVQTQTRCSRLQDLFVRYPGFYSAIAQLFILSLFMQLASIGSAFYLQLVIDEGISRQDQDILVILAAGFLLLAICNVAMGFVRGTVQLYLSNQVGFQMAGNVFARLLGLPVDYFARRHVGDIVSRFGAIREIRHILTEDLVTVVLDGVFALLTLLVMLWFDAMLASVVFGFVLLMAVLKLTFVPAIRTLTEQRIVAEAKTSSSLMENMRVIETIKFYCAEFSRLGLWRHQHAEQINASVQLTRFSLRLEAVYGVLSGFENVVVVYLAATAVLAGDISLGFLTAFVALRSHFSASMRSFIDKLVQIRLLKLQLERVSDITCSDAEFEHFHLPVLRQPVQGELQLKAVSYTYPGNSMAVLRGVSLHIQPGEIIVIAGASGSGKSTLIKLMAGLLSPDSGSVAIDRMDIREFGLRQYRNLCAGVLQGDQLLSGSIRDNITLFADETDNGQLLRACRLACIDDFIASLPMACNSLIGDMGSIMSAGQAQRILLARAFYRQPRILLLDEATANLDLPTEQRVLAAIQSLGMTTIIMTHRPAPFAIATRAYRFSEGELAEWSMTLPASDAVPGA